MSIEPAKPASEPNAPTTRPTPCALKIIITESDDLKLSLEETVMTNDYDDIFTVIVIVLQQLQIVIGEEFKFSLVQFNFNFCQATQYSRLARRQRKDTLVIESAATSLLHSQSCEYVLSFINYC